MGLDQELLGWRGLALPRLSSEPRQTQGRQLPKSPGMTPLPTLALNRASHRAYQLGNTSGVFNRGAGQESCVQAGGLTESSRAALQVARRCELQTGRRASLRFATILSLLLASLGLRGAQDWPADRPLSASFRGQFSYGPAAGFLQTPAGGQPGSSSRRRPTLDELDINDAAFYDVLASVQWPSLSLYAGYQAVGLDGQALLSRSLISRNITFPAGTRVQSSTDLNWFRAGAGWKFSLFDRRLELVPKAEFAVLDFKYGLSGGGQAVQRSYPKGCVRLGLESRYRFSRVVSVSLTGEGSLPISNTPQIAALTGGVTFDLLPASRRVRPALFLGGGAQRIDYEDNQKLPNHFRVDLGPVVTTGLAISF